MSRSLRFQQGGLLTPSSETPLSLSLLFAGFGELGLGRVRGALLLCGGFVGDCAFGRLGLCFWWGIAICDVAHVPEVQGRMKWGHIVIGGSTHVAVVCDRGRW